jgi:hypothetical protein
MKAPNGACTAATDDDPSRTGTITSELLPNSSYGSMMMRKRMPNQSEEVKSLMKLSAWSFLQPRGEILDGNL